MYKLKCTDFPWDKFNLTTGAYRLGSSKDNEIVLENSSVAEHHCEIVVTGSTMTLRDLSSSHETYVNEQKVDYTFIKLGDRLRLGLLEMLLEEDAPVVAAAETPPSAAPAQAAAARAPSVGQRPGKAWGAFAKTALTYALLLLGVGAILVLVSTRWSSSGRTPRPAQAGRSGEKPDPKKEAATPGPGEKGDPEAETADEPREKFSPKETKRAPHLDVAAAQAEIHARHYDRAEPFLHRALQNQQSSLGPEHADVAKTASALGNVYHNLGRHGDAEPFLELALTNTQKLRGPEHPETAAALSDLGEVQLASGQTAKAAPLLERALAIREKELPESEELAESLNNVAALQAAQGNQAKAKQMMERAANLLEKSLDPKDPRVAQALDNLAEINRATGDPAKAEPILQRALKMKERSLDKKDPSIAKTLNALATAQAAKGDLQKAEPNAQRALQIAEKAFGPEDLNTAKALSNLAKIEQKMGQSAKASPHFQRAAKIAEQALGPDHPRTIASLEQAAAISDCQGDKTKGPDLARKSLRAKQRLMTALVWYATSDQRLAYRDLANPYTLAVSLKDPQELALSVLRYKGVMVDSLLEDRLLDRAGRKGDNRDLIDKLRATRDGLAQLAFDIPKDSEAKTQENHRSDMQTLATYLTMLQSGLEKLIPGFGGAIRALNVNPDQVKWGLPDQGALLELFRYTRCGGENQRELCYGAVIFVLNAGPAWVSLGPADAIEKSILEYQKALEQTEARSSRPATPTAGARDGAPPAPAADPVSGPLRNLYQRLWEPLEPLLPRNAQSVFISPDGALNLVPFAALLDSSNRFLALRHSIRYLSSGRDLIGAKKAPRQGSMLIFANPDFAAAPAPAGPASNTNSAPVNELDRQDLQTLQLPALASAAEPTAALEVQLRKWEWPLSLYSGTEAAENQLALINSPRILHLATRSFFLSEGPRDSAADDRANPLGLEPFDEPSGANPPTPGGLMPESARLLGGSGPKRNPTQRNGVALSGAQTTLKAWGRGENPAPDNDGIITADELSTHKLEGTELVVLSNCDTGIGTVRAGEGILTLRRAFQRAGAENLLMTVRPVPEEEAAKFLEDFYERFRTLGNAPQALAEVQREWLVRLEKERGLSAAVRIAGTYVLSSRGPFK